MKRLRSFVVIAGLVLASSITSGQQPAEDQRALRERVEQRFDVVPLTDGVGLRPKSAIRDVRLIEINDGTILINGVPVTGRELRERLGSDSDLVLRLSYLDPDARRSLLSAPAQTGRPEDVQPPLEKPAPSTPETSSPRRHRSNGDRVRIFGSIFVPEDEAVSGQAVAVMGSVRVDGEVGDQVVAVLGSVDLGPKAVVRGDVVSVGGRVRRQEGAQIRGAVTEVAFSEPNVHLDFLPLFDWQRFWLFERWHAVPRLIGTTFRFLLLVLLASLAMVIARPTVEASAHRVVDNPVKAILVGLAAQVLVWPVLFITGIVLAISIIGIPLLLLLPFAVLVLLVLALVGFTGVAYAVGEAARRRVGQGIASPFFGLFLGILVILLPLFAARVLAFAGWPATPIVILLILAGLAVEFVAWSAGFGAVLTNAFTRWQSRRAAQVVVAPAPAPPPPPA
jgi:hypothetical protein